MKQSAFEFLFGSIHWLWDQKRINCMHIFALTDFRHRIVNHRQILEDSLPFSHVAFLLLSASQISSDADRWSKEFKYFPNDFHRYLCEESIRKNAKSNDERMKSRWKRTKCSSSHGSNDNGSYSESNERIEKYIDKTMLINYYYAKRMQKKKKNVRKMNRFVICALIEFTLNAQLPETRDIRYICEPHRQTIGQAKNRVLIYELRQSKH